ncbi:hypothetical protein GJ496_006405 [Pomphorhynchus laevis]|nr:hypothetical protein GJ496_006405 [Pomphorhynchus laevis]
MIKRCDISAVKSRDSVVVHGSNDGTVEDWARPDDVNIDGVWYELPIRGDGISVVIISAFVNNEGYFRESKSCVLQWEGSRLYVWMQGIDIRRRLIQDLQRLPEGDEAKNGVVRKMQTVCRMGITVFERDYGLSMY